MDDTGIIELFFNRDERAISETKRRYGAFNEYMAPDLE